MNPMKAGVGALIALLFSLAPLAADRAPQQIGLGILGMTQTQVEKEFGPPVTRATFSQDQIQQTGPDFHYFKKAWFPGRVIVPASTQGETWFYDFYGFSVTFTPDGRAQAVCVFLPPIQNLTTGGVFGGAEGYFPLASWNSFAPSLRQRIQNLLKAPATRQDDLTFSTPVPVYETEEKTWTLLALWPQGSNFPAMVVFQTTP